MSEFTIIEKQNDIYTLKKHSSGYPTIKQLILNNSKIGIGKTLSIRIDTVDGSVDAFFGSDWLTLTQEEINKVIDYVNNIPKEQINNSQDKYLNLLISEIIAQKDCEIVRMVHDDLNDKYNKGEELKAITDLINYQKKFKTLKNGVNYISVNCLSENGVATLKIDHKNKKLTIFNINNKINKETIKTLKKGLKEWTVEEKEFSLGKEEIQDKHKDSKIKSTKQVKDSDIKKQQQSMKKQTTSLPTLQKPIPIPQQKQAEIIKELKKKQKEKENIEIKKQTDITKESAEKHHHKKQKLKKYTEEIKEIKKDKKEVKEITTEEIDKMSLDDLNTNYEDLKQEIYSKFNGKIKPKIHSKQTIEDFKNNATIEKDENLLLIYLEGTRNLLKKHENELKGDLNDGKRKEIENKIKRDNKWIDKIETALKYKEKINTEQTERENQSLKQQSDSIGEAIKTTSLNKPNKDRNNNQINLNN